MPNKSTSSVVVQLAGGMGNQLFEYAMARRLSLSNGVPLILDHLSGFPRDFYRRSFSLHHFEIRCGFIDDSESYATLTGRIRRRIDRFINSRRRFENRYYIQEPADWSFDPRIIDFRVRRRVNFEGIFQHESYFRDIADTIRADFKMKTPHDAVNVECARRIADTNSVCLHVRRLHGVPNVANPIPLAGVHLAGAYYERAVTRMAERVRNPTFFIFADHPGWAKENIKVPFPHEFVTHNGPDKDYEDFWLMSQCRHFIIANSTFSWWTAWLGSDPDKIVFVPQDKGVFYLRDVPQGWEVM